MSGCMLSFYFARGSRHAAYRRLPCPLILVLSLITLMAIASPVQAQTVTVSTLAGKLLTPGSTNGQGTAASFNRPNGVAVDDSGNVYVADRNNHLIRKITPQGVVSTLAGQAETPGSTNGQGTAARFNNPRGVAVDSSGNVYVPILATS